MSDKKWFKARGYLHFNNRLNPIKDYDWANEYVRNPSKISKHSFYPLLHKKITQRKYKIISYNNGLSVRSHTKRVNGKTVSNKKVRPIHYAAHLDAQIYAYYSQEIIQNIYEKKLSENKNLSECISAYRRIPTGNGTSCKSNIHFAKDVFENIKSRKDGCCALAFDIENFFNGLDHQILKQAWCRLLGKKQLPGDHYNIFKSITNYKYVMLNNLRQNPLNKRSPFDEKHLARLRSDSIHSFFENASAFRDAIASGNLPIYRNQTINSEKKLIGIPQGLPISATLANIYLYDFDEKIYQKIVAEAGGFYRRYSDDIVIICNIEKYEEVKEFVENAINEFKVKIASQKTEVCIFKCEYGKPERLVPYTLNRGTNSFKRGVPFRYLGFEFYGDKTLVKSSNLSKFYRRLKKSVKTKRKQIQRWKKNTLDNDILIRKSKLYKKFTLLGYRSKQVRYWKTKLKKDKITGKMTQVRFLSFRRYRGNVLTYAWRAANILNEPAIRRQFRKSYKILKSELNKVLSLF